jgi:DNA-binding NarL/FixJ family response regulator
LSESGELQGNTSETVPVLLVGMDGGVARDALAAVAWMGVTQVESFAEAALSLRTQRPRVIVVALAKAQPRDLTLLEQLVETARGIPLLLVSPPATEDLVVGSLKAGVAGYLFGRDVEHLPTAVGELLRGGVPMSAPVSELVLRRARRSSASMAAVRMPGEPPVQLLTERQVEILRLLQLGHSYEDIGSTLGLSVNTVRSHVRSVYERLGASTKVEAVMIGMELGILERTRLATRPPPKP